MKGKRELDKLIISYLLKELNSEDEAFIIDQINSDEKSRKHFEELKNTWKLLAIKKELDKVDISNEWNHFVQTIAREKQQLIPVKKSETPDDKAVGEVYINKRNGGRRTFISMAVAASLVTLVVLVLKFATVEKHLQPLIAKLAIHKAGLSSGSIRREINTTGKRKILPLQDGSEIILFDKSEVSYPEPFGADRRDITLKGKADFKVAKDKTKPFTVFSLDLATTALGTRFTVSAFENEENIVVKLYEGKVVIKSLPGVRSKLDSDYYLLPGQVLVYNNRSFTAKRSSFNLRNPWQNNSRGESVSDDLDITHNQKGSWNMFNNQSLEQVFDELKVLYNTDIIFSKKEVNHLYFIGTFERSDSLNYILSTIASMNNLKVSKKDNRFIITK